MYFLVYCLLMLMHGWDVDDGESYFQWICSGFLQSLENLENLENLEKHSNFTSVREKSGKKIGNWGKSGKSQGIL